MQLKLAARRYKGDCRTLATVTGSPAPGSAEAHGILPASARIGSVAGLVNKAGQNDPAWEQLGEEEVREKRGACMVIITADSYLVFSCARHCGKDIKCTLSP